MPFLSSLFETKRADSGRTTNASGAIARATGSAKGVSFGGAGGLGQVGAWDIDQAVQQGLEKVVWIYRCVDAIAQNQAGIPILLRKGLDRRESPVVDDTRLWKLLNFRANSYERSWQFRYRLSGQLLLARRGAFVEVIMGKDGRPSELHLLPAGQTRPVPDKDYFVKEYEVTRSDYQIDTLPADRVIWLRLKPHPTDPYAQMTPLMAAGIDADTDYLARVFNRNFLANDGRPSVLVTIDGGPGGLPPDDAATIKERFSGGPYNAGRTTVLEAANINVADLGANPRDLMWKDLLDTSKDRILMSFGVPESVMGNASGRTYDNADAERENFYIDTMVNHCDNIAASFDPLSGDIEDDTVFGFDYSKIDVLQRALTAKREEWRAEQEAGLITIDEYRKRCGIKTWGVPGTQALILSNGIMIGPTPEIQKELEKLTPPAAPAQPGTSPAAIASSARAGASIGSRLGVRKFNNLVAARALSLGSKGDPVKPQTKVVARYTPPVQEDIVDAEIVPPGEEEKTHPYLGARTRLEGLLEGVVLGWDNNQESIVTERLKHAKFRQGTRHWDGAPGTKALNGSYAVEVDRWAGDLKSSMQTIIRRAVLKEMKDAAKDLDSRGVLDLMIERGMVADDTAGVPFDILFGDQKDAKVNAIVDRVMAVVDAAAQNQSKRVARKIEELDAQGYNMKQIEQEVRRMIGVRSPWRRTLATNLTTTAIEGAKSEVYGTAGTLVTKIWNTVSDERVRQTHRRVDGQEQKMGKTFRVGRARLQYPGQPVGHPEEEINCRCWLEYQMNYDAVR